MNIKMFKFSSESETRFGVKVTLPVEKTVQLQRLRDSSTIFTKQIYEYLKSLNESFDFMSSHILTRFWELLFQGFSLD